MANQHPTPDPHAPLTGAWDLYAASYALRGDERHAPAYFLAQNDRAALAIATMGGARSWPDTLEDSKITAVDRSLVALALLTFAAQSDDQSLLDLARQIAREMPSADALRGIEALRRALKAVADGRSGGDAPNSAGTE